MQIWIDGDACPKPIKTVIFKAAQKRRKVVFFVANHFIDIPASAFIRRIIVTQGADKSDDYILEKMSSGDLIITSDILLADAAIAKNARVLNPKGVLYTSSCIKQALSLRNFHQSLREAGLASAQSAPLNTKDIQKFSAHFDKILNASIPKPQNDG